jgi:Cu(I)/Ag(I) efflux system membrane fusion protein
MEKRTKKTIYLVLGALLMGLLLGGILFGGTSKEAVDEAEHAHTENTTWTCSMHPQVRKEEPGQCPLCGMDLIPLSTEVSDSNNPMEVRMSPTAMQLANVQTTIVTKRKAVKEIRMNGKVMTNERNVISQSSHIPGRIEKLLLNFTGESVQKGDILAYVYSPDLLIAQEELFEAKKIKEAQPELYKAALEKLKNWKLTDNQINRLLEEEAVQEYFPILADVSGIVLDKKVKVGDYIRKGQSIYEIADLTTVWVLLDVYESDLAWVNLGDELQFTAQAMPGEIFKGKVAFIDPVIDPKSRVASIRVEVANPGMRFKPGMFVIGNLETTIHEGEELIIVPKSAVMWTGERSLVYVKVNNTNGLGFEMREVLLGPDLGDSYVIKSGLEEGVELATNGTFSIDAAAQLAGKPSMMNPEGGFIMTGHNHGEAKNMSPKSTDHIHLKEISLNYEASETLKLLYSAYFLLKNALVEDDLKTATTASESMETLISKVGMDVFTGEAHRVWMERSKILEEELRKAKSTEEIEKMRLHFRTISEQMILLIKTFGSIDQTIYLDYCPMANSNHGAEWLSAEKEIKNPYFGASMIGCGEIKQEIN